VSLKPHALSWGCSESETQVERSCESETSTFLEPWAAWKQERFLSDGRGGPRLRGEDKSGGRGVAGRRAPAEGVLEDPAEPGLQVGGGVPLPTSSGGLTPKNQKNAEKT
jgi:hypothetical protein